jgi:putative ABC transport system permease protein
LRSPEGKLAPLAVISIAVSVTLATGLEMASRSAQAHLDATAEAIIGSAEIEVVAGEVGVPEEVLEIVRSTPGVRAASPLVSVKVRLVQHPFPLNIIGVDLVAEEYVRKTAIERNGLEIRDPLRLLASPNSIVVTESLLERLGLGDRYRSGESIEIPVRVGENKASLTVQGVLRATGVAAAFSGQVAVMDIYAAQLLGSSVGRFDRIDIVPERSSDTATLISQLSARLEGVATVQPSSARSGVAEDMLLVVRRSALIIAGAAALVSCLLTYATMAQWVERQHRQLATLRAVGMEARRVRLMIFTEVLALSGVGTLVGVAAGIAISPPLLTALSTFVQVVAIEEFKGVSFQASTLWLALVVGLMSGVAGSVVPARRAARRFTLDSLDILDVGGAATRSASRIGWIALLALVAVLIAGRGAIEGGAILRAAMTLSLGVLALLALAPLILNSLRLPLHWAEAWRPDVSHLATRFLRARPLTFAVALSAISTLVGVLVAVFLLIATIGSAMERWTEARLVGDPLLVLPTPIASPIRGELLSPVTMDLIRTTPGVAMVNEQYRGRASVVFRGQTIPIGALDAGAVVLRGHIPTVGRSSADLGRDLLDGDVAVSPGVTIVFGLTEGDTLALDTPNGRRQFKIAGVYEDFGEKNGSILMDLKTYDANWARSGASSAFVWVDGSADAAMEEIQRRVGTRQDLFFVRPSELMSENRKITEVFTSTLYVLGAFISLLGGIGVMILLAGIVADRRRDLAVLRAAGAEPRQLVAIILADALVLGFLGAGFGCVLGLVCATPAADVPRESYGWILEQRWFAPEIPVIVAGAFLVAFLGALIPARMAYRTHADEVFGPE